MTENLVLDAVRNRRDEADISFWDRLFAVWFQRLVYTQIWEDPVADMAALQLPEGSNIVTISSGGCNALSYLTAKPKQVYAVDLNETHLALLKLKLAGLRAYSTYGDFWRFFGAADDPANRADYLARLRPLLDEPARRYWDGRDLTLQPRYRYFADGFFRHGMLGGFIGFAHWVADRCGIDRAALLHPDPANPDRVDALLKVDTLFSGRFMRWLSANPALLFSLGIPPRQRVLLAGDGPGGLADVLRQRLLRLLADFPTSENYFAWQAMQRRYPGPGNRCLPPYLQQRHFEQMRQDAGRVLPVHGNMRDFLRSLPRRSVDAVVLLDAQDWMADAEIAELWQAIDACGSDQVRVLFRTAGTASPLQTPVLGDVAKGWARDDERSAQTFENDRSGIYGAVHLYQRR
ncbi:DUF3419 family protein [Ferrovibrio sp.]|uniref:DUF3419 family protein n=1 Tax=Ferrovibrio sp. TaxID=1917215 RepID=UPI003D0FAD4E